MSSPKPYLVGITGGIGAGKSTVCKVFAALGIPVYDADTRAKWISSHHPGVVAAVKETFGEEAYESEGVLDRAFLAKEVFDKGRAAELNAIVHPRVGQDFADWVSKHSEAPYLIKEAALMIESGSYKALDAVINVLAPKEVRVARVLQRDPQRSREQVEAIISKQLSDEERGKHSSHTLQNDGEHSIIEQAMALHREFSAKAAR